MKYAIRYYSKFGHSEQMAQAVSDVLGVKAESVETPLTEEVALLFIGAGLFLAKVNGRVKEFARTLDPKKVKKIVCFGSCALSDSPVPQLRKIFEELGFTVATESFTCRGSMGPWHGDRPNAQDLEELRRFTRQFIQK